MSAVLQNDEPTSERASGNFRRLERNRVLSSMDDQGRNGDMAERGRQVEITETAPDALLDASHDTKRREVVRPSRVGEVAGDAELEAALAVRVGVSLAETRGGQLGAQSLDDGPLLAAREFRFELLAVFASDGSRIDQSEGIGNRESGIGRAGNREQGTGHSVAGAERVEHRQQTAPRVADDLGAVEPELVGDGGEVFDVRLPGYRRRVIRPRLAAAALVIEHQLVVF